MVELTADLTIRTAGVTLGPVMLGGFAGIRVIPDVHGAFDAFDHALKEAERDRRFVVQLGDLIDRGPYSSLCVERMLEVERRGLGHMLMGNHGVAFARFILFDAGNAVTRHATLMEFQEYGGDLLERWIERIQAGPLWIRSADHLFVHAAFHPRMLGEPAVTPDAETLDAAVHGGGTANQRRRTTRSRSWVDKVPGGMTVVVGHAVTPSGSPEMVDGRLGGQVIFADTGFWRDPHGRVPIIDVQP